jgi:hypothetical protein
MDEPKCQNEIEGAKIVGIVLQVKRRLDHDQPRSW